MARRTPQQKPAVLATITFMTPPDNPDQSSQTISIPLRIWDEGDGFAPTVSPVRSFRRIC